MLKVIQYFSLFTLIILGACRGEVSDTYIQTLEDMELKLEQIFERTFMGGTKFNLKARKLGENKWANVATFRFDGPIDIPRGNLTIIEPSTAFFYLSNKYVVTSDGGKSWSLWNTTKDIHPPCPYASWI